MQRFDEKGETLRRFALARQRVENALPDRKVIFLVSLLAQDFFSRNLRHRDEV